MSMYSIYALVMLMMGIAAMIIGLSKRAGRRALQFEIGLAAVSISIVAVLQFASLSGPIVDILMIIIVASTAALIIAGVFKNVAAVRRRWHPRT